MSSSSAWQTDQLAKTFLEGVRGAIPGADLQFEVIGKITQQWQPTPKRILDLGCGDGLLGRFLLSRYSAAEGVFVDFSDPMIEAARNQVGDMPRASVVKADFGAPEWRREIEKLGRFDIIISGFAIHHQPDERKRALYAELFTLLAPGGVLLNLEHVASSTPAGNTLFDDFFIDHLFAFHGRRDPEANREQIAAEFYKRPDKTENILAPLDVQCAWLRQIGFVDVDCFFKVFELALFGGRKSA